jgi:hypothetical protein
MQHLEMKFRYGHAGTAMLHLIGLLKNWDINSLAIYIPLKEICPMNISDCFMR